MNDVNIYPACPACGKSYYYENYSTVTCMYWAPLYKDGVLINRNPNKTTHYCTCAACGREFTFQTGGENEYN